MSLSACTPGCVTVPKGAQPAMATAPWRLSRSRLPVLVLTVLLLWQSLVYYYFLFRARVLELVTLLPWPLEFWDYPWIEASVAMRPSQRLFPSLLHT